MNKSWKCFVFASSNFSLDPGMTVLHRVAMDGYLEGCHLLVMYGKANINSRCDGGYTPIMWAAEHKQADMAKYLVHYGADLTLVDDVSCCWARVV